jgi:hypothetical protein
MMSEKLNITNRISLWLSMANQSDFKEPDHNRPDAKDGNARLSGPQATSL